MRLWPSSLLWRTVALFAVLLTIAQIAAVQVFLLSEREPRARRIGQQVANVVNLARAALVTADPKRRADLLAELSEHEGIQIRTSDQNDAPKAQLERAGMSSVAEELRRLLGPQTVAILTPDRDGTLWVSFEIADDSFWLVIPPGRLERPFPWRWLSWLAGMFALTILGAYLIVSRVNRPLRELTQAAPRLGRGESTDALAEDGPAEVRALTRAFNQMTIDLSRLEFDRALLLAGVSHDLRTPLSRLRLAIELAPEDQATGDKLGMIQDIEDMDAIVGQFLAFVKEGSGEAKQAVELNELVRSVAHRYLRLGQCVQLDLAPLPKLPVRRMAVQRLLSNLLDNAFKYGGRSEQQAEVSVQTWQQSGKIYLSVLDRGMGVPKSQAERLLQPFARLDTSRSNATGSGLGLAIVERIARAHGGRLQLLPRTGGGLEARVELTCVEL